MSYLTLSDEARIKKLPTWAQELIGRLTGRFEESDRLICSLQPTVSRLSNGYMERRVLLPDLSGGVTFNLPARPRGAGSASRYIQVRYRSDDYNEADGLYVAGSDSLVVLPLSSNTFDLELRR